jgi:hypothetical protein
MKQLAITSPAAQLARRGAFTGRHLRLDSWPARSASVTSSPKSMSSDRMYWRMLEHRAGWQGAAQATSSIALPLSQFGCLPLTGGGHRTQARPALGMWECTSAICQGLRRHECPKRA